MTDATERRVALVTGASRGIGAAIACRLALDGFAVAINTHPAREMREAAWAVAELIRASGGAVEVIPADISDATEVDSLFSTCEQRLGSPHALVLSAAATARRPWVEISDLEWNHVVSVNLTGAFLCCRRAFGRPHSPRRGTIVTIGSVLARVGAPNSLHYGTTKAGLVGFTRSLARELGPAAIRVNCVMPGAIQTEQEREAFPGGVDARALARQALQRRGLPEDVAAVVSFLAADDSSFITGQTFGVDGGWGLSCGA